MEHKSGGFALATDHKGDAQEIAGYASTFGNVDLVNDRVLSGAFSETIRQRPELPLLWQHSSDSPVGKVFLMNEDNHGLFFKARIIDTTLGSDARKLGFFGVFRASP